MVKGVIVRSHDASSGSCLIGATLHVIPRSALLEVAKQLVLRVELSGDGSCQGTAVIKSPYFGGAGVQVSTADIIDIVDVQSWPVVEGGGV